jgi:succinyl-CoA synthetase beta subunit
VLVELLDTACIRLAPLDLNEARQAVMRYPQAAKLLRGMRGRPGGDVDALVQLLHRLSHFFVAHSSLIEEIEINPVIVRPEGRGVVVVDALMTLR